MKKLMMTLSVATALTLVACGGGAPADEKPVPAAPPAATAAPVDPATAGNINGKVTLEGTAPAPDKIQMAADPNCARLHTTPVTTEFVVVGDGGTLANVFVYVKKGLEGKSFPTPTEPIVLDQHGCQYIPVRVLAALGTKDAQGCRATAGKHLESDNRGAACATPPRCGKPGCLGISRSRGA